MFLVKPDAIIRSASNEIAKGRKVHMDADEVEYIARSMATMEGFGECIRKLLENADVLHAEARSLTDAGNALQNISAQYRICERNVVNERSWMPSFHRNDWSWNDRVVKIVPIYHQIANEDGIKRDSDGVSQTIKVLGDAII